MFFKMLNINYNRGGLYVQYGCGWDAPKDWINFDASLTLRFERIPIIGKIYTKNKNRFPKNVQYGDIVRGLPLHDHSCRGIYASHVLEHLPLCDFEKALKETFRLLDRNGIFRLVVPDLSVLAKRYVDAFDEGKPEASLQFMRDCGIGMEKGQRTFRDYLICSFGRSRHQWMWDCNSLQDRLSNHGFVNIRHAMFNDCEDPHFSSVEEESRFKDAIALECRAPY